MRSDHQRLLRAAGFDDITEIDVTPAFVATAAAWLAETVPCADELATLEPPGAFEQRQADRRSMLAAIQAGLLRRTLVLAWNNIRKIAPLHGSPPRAWPA